MDSGYGFAPCVTCPKCGSTLAFAPDRHAEPEPHNWVPFYDQHTGKPTHERCTKCHAIRKVEEEVPG